MVNPQLTSSQKTKNLVKLTGDIEVDVMANLKSMLARELKNDSLFALKTLEIYDSDTANIPRFPAITLDLQSSENIRRTMGSDSAGFTRRVNINLWYYQDDISEKSAQIELTKSLSRISSVINRNADLNGYCRLGMSTGSARMAEKTFGENKIMKCIMLPIVIPIMYRDRSAGPA